LKTLSLYKDILFKLILALDLILFSHSAMWFYYKRVSQKKYKKITGLNI
jgi:hypothetical protein